MLLRITLVLLVLFSISATPFAGISQEITSENQEVKSKEEDDENSKSLRKALESLLLVDIYDEVGYLSQNKTLLDFSSFKVDLQFDRFASPKLKIESAISKLLPLFIISPNIPDPFIGSPAYEGIYVPRKRLNIDPVTGKYYWEW